MGVGAPVEDMMMPVGKNGKSGINLHNGGKFRTKRTVLSRNISGAFAVEMGITPKKR